jgi:hypothetical protein
VPNLSIGRIPADSAGELAAVVRKVIRYEQQAEHGPWERCLNIVAGAGGFGAVADALIEAAGRQVIQQVVPPDYDVRHLAVRGSAGKSDPRGTIRDQFREGSLAWIYMGHALPTELDRVPNSSGRQSILSVDDVPNLRCGSNSPLAVLVACYAGACDAPRDGLAEELSLAEAGPVAVIAATRVTMPYGNTVFGYELLRACFHDRPQTLGESLRLAQSATLRESNSESLRGSLDALAQGLSPPPIDLAAERAEHVLMYHLLGDPLLRLRIPPAKVAQSVPGASIAK